MSILIKSVTAKNFLSIGNQTQAVEFNKDSLTLVLGTNVDLGGDDAGSRNGVGKSAILNAISYALYGQALTNIRKENLINKTNGKGMLVTVEFSKDNVEYRIERGRKPNVLKLYVNNQVIKSVDKDDDESQGDSRETQRSIEHTLEMSHTMFKHLVALNTYTEPFLSMRSSDQREVIEQLLGITLLSEKAELLKIQIKDNKELIQQETFKIESIKSANNNVQVSINSLIIKKSAWNTKRDNDVEALNKAIIHLENVDIEEELINHSNLKVWDDNDKKIKSLRKQKAMLETANFQANVAVEKYISELTKLDNHQCPACEQELHDSKYAEMSLSLRKQIEDSTTYLNTVTNDLATVVKELEAIGDQPRKPNPFYETEAEALGHKNNLKNLEKELINRVEEQNPYDEQIEELKNTAIQEINWDSVNSITKVKDHQEFLFKLLTNKDSFIRKKIIDQNLTYLNKRLTHYIDRLGLPHKVVFQNDLNVEITQLGQDLDFDNLSRGERNRLILSMSFAFRDVWESLYQSINLLFIDELMDAGMDYAGVESALSVLKKMARERQKNIYLISHKDELVGRVNNVLKVVKSNGFTSYEICETALESN